AEHAAISMLVRLMKQWAVPVHIVHLSSSTSLEIIRAAKSERLRLTVETCPHYLTFASEEILDGATEYKCAPPIRGSIERELLWDAVIAGDIDLIASDHSPCPPSMKETSGDFSQAWGGIASLQISLAAVWTGARARGQSPDALARWMSTAPAKLAGLSDHKGKISPGYDADITIWDPDKPAGDARNLPMHRHHLTPYADVDLYGLVEATYVMGRLWDPSQT
nr:amidohydrolase family protein [Gemmatimonadota bacterium]